MNSQVRIPESSIIVVLLYILQFVKMPYTPQFNYVRMLLLVVVAIYILSYVYVLFFEKVFKMNLLIVMFSASIMYTAIINRPPVTNIDTVRATINFMLIFFESFFAYEIIAYTSQVDKVLNILKSCAIIECIIVDFLLFFKYDFFHVRGQDFLIGSKFAIAYAHMFAFIFSVACLKLKENDDRWLDLDSILVFIASVFICIKVDCMTGLIGCLLFLGFYLVWRSWEKISYVLNNGVAFAVSIILSFLYIFVADLIIAVPSINHFIHTYLDEEGTMESRNRIFKMSLKLIEKKMIWGYGYSSSYSVGMAYGKFANTQNSTLEWIYQAGVIGSGILFILLGYILQLKTTKETNNQIFPLVIVIYILVIMGTVEIVFNSAFFAFFAIILMFALNKDYFSIQNR